MSICGDVFMTHEGVEVRHALKKGEPLTWIYLVDGEVVDVRRLPGFDESALTMAESMDRERHRQVLAAEIDRSAAAAPAHSMGPVIYAYTRAQALADGVLVDLAALAPDVCRQHCGDLSVVATESVYQVLERAERHPRWMNDWAGLIHDVLWMALGPGRLQTLLQRAMREGVAEREFEVIVRGAGRQSVYRWRIHVGPGDVGEPVVTVMGPGED